MATYGGIWTTSAAAANNGNPPQWLATMKADALQGNRPRNRAVGRWIGDFLNQSTASGLLPAEVDLLDACAAGGPCFGSGPYSSNPNPGRRITLTRNGFQRNTPPSPPALPRVRTHELPIPETAWVRASLLRFLILGGDDYAPVHENGLELHNAYIDGTIDLRGAHCVSRIALVDCYVDGALTLEDATLGILYLEGSRLRGIKANRAKFGGSVFLTGHFTSKGLVDLYGAQIGGTLQCGGARLRRMGAPNALVCTAARIAGSALLNQDFKCDGHIWFNGSDVKGNLDFTSAQVSRKERIVISCSAALIGGDILLCRASVGGEIRLQGTKISGRIDGSDLRVSNGVENTNAALNWERVDIAGEADLSGAVLEGQVNLFNARIGADLNCSGMTISGISKPGVALEATSITVVGQVFLSEIKNTGTGDSQPFAADGAVTFYGAEIGRDFNCWGGRFTSSSTALNLSASKIKGAVNLGQAYYAGDPIPGQRFQAQGLVAMYGAQVLRDLNCQGGSFANSEGDALALDSARIEGQVLLCQLYSDQKAYERFEAQGTVSLQRTNIAGDLNCKGGLFRANKIGPGEINAIKGDGLVVGECVFLCGPTVQESSQIPGLASFESFGGVRLVGAQVGMQLSCVNGIFVNTAAHPTRHGTAAYALKLDISTISFELLLGQMGEATVEPATIKGSLSLKGLKTRALSDRGFVNETGPVSSHFPRQVMGSDSEPLSCVIQLDGFSYDRIDSESCHGASARKAWLMRQPQDAGSGDFRHQPYDWLAKVFSEAGQANESRAIKIFKQREITKRITMPWKATAMVGTLVALISIFSGLGWLAILAIALILATKAGYWLWRIAFQLLVEYGYEPARGLIIALLIATGTGWFYEQAQVAGALVRAHADEDKTGVAGTPFHPYVYSFEVMIPVVKLGQVDAWKPSGKNFALKLPTGPIAGVSEIRIGENGTQNVVWIETVCGWLAGGILLGLVSGIIKKD